MMNWTNFRQLKGQNVQEYTQELRRRALLLGVYLQSQGTLINYIGGLHSYLRHTILMFNPTSLDEVCVQATHLEARGENTFEEGRNKPFKGKNKEKTSKGNVKKNAYIKKEGEKWFVNIVQENAMKRKIVGNYILKRDPSITITKGSRKLQLHST